MRSPQFLRHAAVYGFATLVVNACGFFLLPLYLRCLSPGEYGVLEWLRTVGDVVIICLFFGGVKQALLSFHGQSETPAQRRRVIGTALALGGGVALLAALALLLFGVPLAQFLRCQNPRLLQATVGVVLLEALSGLLMTGCQARLESGLFMTVTIIQFFLRVGLSILFAAYLSWGIWGMLVASAATAASTTLLLLSREIAFGGLWPDRRTLAALGRFALPFVPGGLGFFLLHSGDRFFLMEYGGDEAVGLYALGYKLAMAVSLFSRSPLYMVWNTQMHEVARRPDAGAVFGRAFSRILAAYLGAGLALCLFADEAALLLGGARYAAAAAIVPTVVLAYYCLTAADLMDAGFYVTQRTSYKTPITLASTAAMVVLYATLIPAQGAMGAALATLGGFAFHVWLTWRVSQRVFPVRYEWLRTGAALALAVAAWSMARLTPEGALAIPIKTALWSTWVVALWVLGLVTRTEKHQARETALAALAWLRTPGQRPAVVALPKERDAEEAVLPAA